jgi:hypothetical protein
METSALLTASGPWRKARGTNANDSSFPSRIPTVTPPLTDVAGAAGTQQAIDVVPNAGGYGANAVVIMPYGLGSDNDAFSMRVIGWSSVTVAGVNTLWIPTVLAEFSACNLCAVTGVAGAALLNTERLVDNLTLVTGNDDVSVSIVSPGTDIPAHVVVSLAGSQKVELTFDQTTSTPTQNALIKFI